MNSPKYSDSKGIPRRLYPNPSASHLNNNPTRLISEMSTPSFNSMSNGKKITKFKNQEHSEQRISQRIGSRSDVFKSKPPGQIIHGIGQQDTCAMEQNSRISQGAYKKTNIKSLITQNQQQAIELRERLRNIHHFYRIRIEEERQKNLEKNEIFIGVIEDLQRSHNSKIAALQQQMQSLETEKQDVNYVDQRMQSIKVNIQQILSQSAELKQSNEQLQKQILKKQVIVKEKQQHCSTLKEQIETMRNVLENFQRLKLKQNKRNKQLLDLIQNNLEG